MNTTIGRELGHLGTEEVIKQLLEGEYVIGNDILQQNDATEITAFLDQSVKYPQEIGMVNPIISTKDLQSIFCNTKERTLSSPSGAHMGMWKAALMVDNLSDMLVAATTLPFLYGFTKQRWNDFTCYACKIRQTVYSLSTDSTIVWSWFQCSP